MSVKWINKIEAEGTAILLPSYLQTNREFVSKFIDKYSALVGLDDETDQIVLKPLSLDEDNDVKYRDSLKIKFNIQKSFIRFGNKRAIEFISSQIHIDVPKEGIRGKCKWDENEEALLVTLGGNK